MSGGSTRLNQKAPASRRHPAYIPYMYGVISLGLVFISWSIYSLAGANTGWKWLILAGLTVVSSSCTIRIPATNSKISIGDTFFFTNVILYGIPAGIITAAADALVSSLSARNRSRRLEYALFNVGAITCSAYLCGTAFFGTLQHGPLSQGLRPPAFEMWLPVVVLACVQYLANSGSVAIIVALEKRKNILTIWKDSFLWTSITYFAGAAAAACISLTIGSVTTQIVAVAVPVVFAVYFTYKTYMDKVRQVCSLAYYDSLTGLPNRVLFKEHLNRGLASKASGKMLAVMFVDLDNFKRINDTYGHSVGDLLLKNVAGRLSATLRAKNRDLDVADDDQDVMIGRFGGDEFTILLKNIENPDQVEQVAQRMLAAFANPFSLEGQEVSTAVSIGISLSPLDGVTADALLKNADAAMFQVKDSGRSNYQFYSHSMNETSSAKLELENELRRALVKGEFRLFYQPKVDGATREITGAEALIRWQHPSRGLLPAAEFIAMAEETGLIRPIGDWVLRTACSQIVAWQKSGLPAVPVAVNLSSVQFRQQNLRKIVSDILRETALDPRYLELEITESMIMQNTEEAGDTLRELRSLGCRISIDDFGTGYSSLSRLKHFPLDSLKVDKSFVTDLANSTDDRAITKAIIAMARSLELKVIAEGVENEQQYQFLKTYGCDEFQGYLFGKPMPEDQFAAQLGRSLNEQFGNLDDVCASKADVSFQNARRTRWAARSLRLVHSRATAPLQSEESIRMSDPQPKRYAQADSMRPHSG